MSKMRSDAEPKQDAAHQPFFVARGKAPGMTADEQLEAGQLTGAIDALSDTLRQNPRDAVARSSLFTLLCLSGRWDRASSQLDALESLGDPLSLNLVDPTRYRVLLNAELARQRYFAEQLPPQTFGPAGAAVTLTLAIGKFVTEGRGEQARDLFDQFEAQRVRKGGTIGGNPFDDFQDCEDLLAPVLEVLAPEGYIWVGWDEVQYLDVVPPRSLLDLVWAEARLGLITGVVGVVALPGLYSTSWSHPDEQVRLGRRNDWIDVGAGLVRGAGAKVFDVGGQVKALLELQDLVFDIPSQTAFARSPEADS
jgi:type VI secretion system protein ImpE